MITRMSHATLQVLDVDKAHDFYVGVLGFKIKTDFKMDNGFRWLTVSPPRQPELELTLYVPMPGSVPEETLRMRTELLRQNALGAGVFETDDCEKTHRELSAKGVTFLQPPTRQFYGIEALFLDGCGNWFSLTQRVAAS